MLSLETEFPGVADAATLKQALLSPCCNAKSTYAERDPSLNAFPSILSTSCNVCCNHTMLPIDS